MRSPSPVIYRGCSWIFSLPVGSDHKVLRLGASRKLLLIIQRLEVELWLHDGAYHYYQPI